MPGFFSVRVAVKVGSRQSAVGSRQSRIAIRINAKSPADRAFHQMATAVQGPVRFQNAPG
jgi:hypothetical protein